MMCLGRRTKGVWWYNPSMASDIQIYGNHMAALRDRLNKVQTIMAGRMGTGDKDLDAELIFTQCRKVAECMAYAFLAANQIGYSKKHRDISTVWKAKELLKRLESGEPRVLPGGLTGTPDLRSRSKALRAGAGWLSHERRFRNAVSGLLR